MRERRKEANALQMGRFSETATMSECADVDAFAKHARRRHTRAMIASCRISDTVIRAAEAAATLKAILEKSAIGRHARGPLLARRLLEYRGEVDKAVSAITELERLGMTRLNRTMNRRLVSMSQILDKVLSVLATHKPDTDVKPSSSYHLLREETSAARHRVRKMLGLPVDHASPRSSPSLVSPEPSVKLSGSSPREVT